MNIIYISTVFPKATNSSTIYTDLAEELVKNNHSLTVVAAEERRNSTGTHLSSERGCEILWVKTGNLYNVNLIEKTLSQLSLEHLFIKAIKKHLNNRCYNLILFEAPPVTTSTIIKFSKKLYNAPAFLMMKDIFPQNAVDIGIMKKGGLLYKFFSKKEKSLYLVADTIGCMSQKNCDYIIKNNSQINKNKLVIFPNTKKINPLRTPITNRKLLHKYGVPNNSVVFILGGNMGRPQGIPFLCKAIENLKDYSNIFFLFVGRGTEQEYIKNKFSVLPNALFLDNLPRNQYDELILECDVGIVSLDYRFTIPNYPSRILSYMENSMPVIAATDVNTDFKDLIINSNCGLWCESNNIKQFCINVIKLSENKELRVKMGNNGRTYLENNFSVEKSVTKIEQLYS